MSDFRFGKCEKNVFAAILILYFLFSSLLFAQNAQWVNIKLAGNFPNNYHYKVGETCMIFVDDTSNIVYAFDINLGQWSTHSAPSNAQWKGAEADGNTAMVWSDSTLIAYSALTHTFTPLPAGATLILGGADHGCLDNFSYVVGPSVWYVFDAEDAQWHSYTYTPPGNPGVTLQGGVNGKKDYLYLFLSVLNDAPCTLAAYSLRTKTFAEKNLDYISNPDKLDHGFTFYKYQTGPPSFAGGYSAFSGTFSMKNSTELISVQGPGYYPEIVSTQITYTFTMHEPVNNEFYRKWIWVYNTKTGQFYEYWYLVDYAGTNAIPRGTASGGQFAIDWLQNVGYQDQMECILFSTETNTFSTFFSPLYYWGSIYTSFTAGGNIFDGYDSTKYYLCDVKTGADFSAGVQWESGFYPGVKSRSISNYWLVFAYRDQFEDTLNVFSYSRESGNFSKFKIRNDGASADVHGRNFYWIRLVDSIEPDKVLLYSPLNDNWTEKILSASYFWAGKGDYFYDHSSATNEIRFHNGVTNQELFFPAPQSSQHVFARDSVFLMYSTVGKYIGYSMTQHDSSEFIIPKLGGQIWANYIVLAMNIGGSVSALYQHLLYDGFNNNFAPLNLTTQHGFRKNAWAGGKTAILMSANGYLFAYYPGTITSIREDNRPGIEVINKFELDQNYPNPFNPVTTIKFSLQNEHKTTLKIYDILGREVKTLLAQKMKPGEYKIKFDASGMASGVYLYRLQSGKFVKTRKMILLQ